MRVGKHHWSSFGSIRRMTEKNNLGFLRKCFLRRVNLLSTLSESCEQFSNDVATDCRSISKWFIMFMRTLRKRTLRTLENKTFELSDSTVSRIWYLAKKFHPHKMIVVQQTLRRIFQNRFAYCQRLLKVISECGVVFFSDDARFRLSSCANKT